MPNPTVYGGRGTQLLYSLDNVTFVAVAQLQQFEPSGSKQTIIDQTNLSTPGTFTQKLAVQVDAGQIDFAGVLNPQDASYLALGQLHDALTLAYWRAQLVDGTVLNFQAFVCEFKAFAAKWNKLYTFSGKLQLTGGLNQAGTFQADAFDPLAFATF